MTRSLKNVLADMTALVTEANAILTRQHTAEHAAHAELFGEDATPPVVDPPPAPATQSLPPAPAPAPAAPAFPVVEGAIASTWLDKLDDASGETAKQPAYPWAPRNHTGVGLEVIGIALPFPVEDGDAADIQLADRGDGRPGPWTTLRVIEKGPHHTDDPYLAAGRRPRAESEAGNHAGVDITPAGQALLDGKTAAADYANAPLRRVNIRWHPKGVAPIVVPGGDLLRQSALALARSMVDKPVTYELGAQPPGPASDCSGFVDWVNGIDRTAAGLNTDAIVDDARSARPRYYRLVTGPAQPGDDYVYPSPGAGHYGHTGVISAVDAAGVPTKVIHCSAGNPAGRAVQETDTKVFTSHGAIIVRAVGFAD